MTSPFPFDSLLVFGFLSVLLLVGIAIRAKVSFVQKFLFPSCLIGGIIGIIVINLSPAGIFAEGGLIPVATDQLETFAFHFFSLSFVSIGLTPDDNSDGTKQSKGRFFKGAFWMALTQGITFPLQAIIGGLVVLLFGLFGFNLFQTFGFLAPLGFNEGPGQALSFGKVWEGVGFEHATTVGLTFAAVGFLCAFFIGVPLANWGVRKGLTKSGGQQLSDEVVKGIFPPEKSGESVGNLRLHSSNVDSLAFQAAMVGFVYLITYFIVSLFGKIIGGDSAKMAWGFFFFFGLGISVLVRWLMKRMGIGHMLDAGIQKRITGWSVDFLIVSTIPAIQLMVVWKFVLPIALISTVNAMLTTLVVLYLGRRLLSENMERIVSIFGVVTGTASCGLLLLRIIDPDFKTSVVFELAIMNLLVLPILLPCMLLVNAPLWWGWPLSLTLLAFAGIMVICFSLMKLLKIIDTPRF